MFYQSKSAANRARRFYLAGSFEAHNMTKQGVVLRAGRKCPAGFHIGPTRGKKCYRHINHPKRHWKGAVEACGWHKGRLAEFHTQKEEQEVRQRLVAAGGCKRIGNNI